MATAEAISLKWDADGVAGPIKTNGSDLGGIIERIIAKTPAQVAVDGEEWSRSGYKPTPTIIEAAQALYKGHRVEEITRSDAGAKNLSETSACLSEIIEEAKTNRRKAILFRNGGSGRRQNVGWSQFGDATHQGA